MIRRKLVWEGLCDVSWNLIQQYLPLSKTLLDIDVVQYNVGITQYQM